FLMNPRFQHRLKRLDQLSAVSAGTLPDTHTVGEQHHRLLLIIICKRKGIAADRLPFLAAAAHTEAYLKAALLHKRNPASAGTHPGISIRTAKGSAVNTGKRPQHTGHLPRTGDGPQGESDGKNPCLICIFPGGKQPETTAKKRKCEPALFQPRHLRPVGQKASALLHEYVLGYQLFFHYLPESAELPFPAMVLIEHPEQPHHFLHKGLKIDTLFPKYPGRHPAVHPVFL